MKTTAEKKIENSDTQKNNVNKCVLIEASKLSLKDTFMEHKPKTEAEEKFKATLTEVIKTGVEDFYRPVMDPSYNFNQDAKIHYMEGEMPAIYKSYKWWKETLKDDAKWCFGTKKQYVAFLGILIKMLVSEGWNVAQAWNAVCNDSIKLGHYRDSGNAENTGTTDFLGVEIEYTGSREICGFFDLANTHKLLAEDEEKGGFWLAGGNLALWAKEYPLANFVFQKNYDFTHFFGVPWLVCKK